MRNLCLFVLIVMLPLSAADSFLNSDEMLINLKIYSDIGIIRTSSHSAVRFVRINLSLYPRESYRQDVISFSTSPGSQLDDKYVQFIWEEPSETNLQFMVDADVRTYARQIEVKNKIGFPVDIDLGIYQEPSSTIDSDNPSIFALANHLAKGEDDLYQVVFNLASWVKGNIEYDLSTVTAEATQKASWVLEERQGVCDELTNLFIALNRALGIPARFVSGISYTNSEQFEEEWGPHGWAEVYFPGHGWVPFDITYGQLGYIDTTHIKLKDAVDADDASTKYQWVGRDIDTETKSLMFDVKPQQSLDATTDKIQIETHAIKHSVTFGSYNLVEAEITNLQDYYFANELSLSRPREIEVIEEPRKQILLYPQQKKKIYWTVRVRSDLEDRFIYTFPITISSLENISSSATFSASDQGYYYSPSEIESLRHMKEDDSHKDYSRQVDLNCSIDRASFYTYETPTISCSVRNTGNILLEELDICIGDFCNRIVLGIGERKKVDLDFSTDKVGEHEIIVEAKSQKMIANEFIEVAIHDPPRLEINNITFPTHVSFDEEYTVSFILSKGSVSNPENVIINLNEDGFKKTWTLDEVDNDKKFTVTLKGKDLSVGQNKLDIQLTFNDRNNRQASIEKSFFITLNKVNALQRIQIFFTDFVKFLSRIFD